MTEISIAAPMIITSRLMAGVKIGTGTLSVEIDGRRADGGTGILYVLDFIGPSGERLEYVGNDVTVRAFEGPSEIVREATSCLLSFLGAEAESYQSGMGELPADGWGFNAAVAEWAYMNADEISMLAVEFED